MENLKRIIAFIVKKRGREIVENDFVNVLSYDMKWIAPSSSRALFRVCIDANLLKKEGEKYVPTFEIKGLILPLDFKVSEEDVKKYFTQEDVFTKIMDFLASNLQESRRDILMEINNIKNQLKYVSIEVAALIYCKENGLDCSRFYDDVEKKIREL